MKAEVLVTLPNSRNWLGPKKQENQYNWLAPKKKRITIVDVLIQEEASAYLPALGGCVKLSRTRKLLDKFSANVCIPAKLRKHVKFSRYE